jgi:hypothetical protein
MDRFLILTHEIPVVHPRRVSDWSEKRLYTHEHVRLSSYACFFLPELRHEATLVRSAPFSDRRRLVFPVYQ